MKRFLKPSLVGIAIVASLAISSCIDTSEKIDEPKKLTDSDYYQVVKVVFLDGVIDTLIIPNGYSLTIKSKRNQQVLGGSGYALNYAVGVKHFSVIERKLKP